MPVSKVLKDDTSTWVVNRNVVAFNQTEMVSPNDKRRHYVSGFTGSAGTAVVTDKLAALWTDGRYFLQADQQLDCQWAIMRTGQENVPSVSQWLKSVLSSGDRVGADPKLVSADQWLEWRSDLGIYSLTASTMLIMPYLVMQNNNNANYALLFRLTNLRNVSLLR